MLQVATSSLIYLADRTMVKVVLINNKLIATKSRKYLTRSVRNNQQPNNSLKETNFKGLKNMVKKRNHKFCGHQHKVINTTLPRLTVGEIKTKSKPNQDSLKDNNSNNNHCTNQDNSNNSNNIQMRQFNIISLNNMAISLHTITVTQTHINNSRRLPQTTVLVRELNQVQTQVQPLESPQLSYTNHQVAVLKFHLHE